MTLFYVVFLPHGHNQPLTQQSGAHGCFCLVYDINKSSAFFFVIPDRKQFQIPDTEFVQPHILFTVYPLNGAKMTVLRVLSEFQVKQSSSYGRNGKGQLFCAKTFKAFHTKMTFHLLIGGCMHESPVIYG